MYLPRTFSEPDLAELDRLIARDAFVTLVTVGDDGVPFASHLPVLYRRDGGQVRLVGHWARPNPQARHDGVALAVVHGPHAYISPSWYTQPADHVPTWNYAVAHLRGRLQRTTEREALRALVSELSDRYERPLGSTWQPGHGHPEFEADLAAIVGFELLVESIELKFKLNQNHDAGNVLGAAAGLDARGEPQAAEIASLMRSRLARRTAKETT